VLDTLANARALYVSLGPTERRTLNQAVFERLWVTANAAVGANLAPCLSHLGQADLELQLKREAKLIQTAEPAAAPVRDEGPSDRPTKLPRAP
jgi:hypothetical protein